MREEQGMELLAGSFDLSDAVLIAVMGWMIRWSYRDRKELREEIRAGFAEAKAERRQIREEAAEERRRGFAEARAERERGFAEAKAERRQIREEAAETNRRLGWIGEQVAWLRGRHDYVLEEPVAQQGAVSRG